MVWRCSEHGNARVPKDKYLILKFFSSPSLPLNDESEADTSLNMILCISYKSLNTSDFHVISSLCCGETP